MNKELGTKKFVIAHKNKGYDKLSCNKVSVLTFFFVTLQQNYLYGHIYCFK